ncbi:MAG: hypothetical protein R3D28_20170 [Geminicoccaceae bacterium]
MLLISLVTGEIVVLGLEEGRDRAAAPHAGAEHADLRRRAHQHAAKGVVHLVIFLVYLVLVFNP